MLETTISFVFQNIVLNHAILEELLADQLWNASLIRFESRFLSECFMSVCLR